MIRQHGRQRLRWSKLSRSSMVLINSIACSTNWSCRISSPVLIGFIVLLNTIAFSATIPTTATSGSSGNSRGGPSNVSSLFLGSLMYSTNRLIFFVRGSLLLLSVSLSTVSFCTSSDCRRNISPGTQLFRIFCGPDFLPRFQPSNANTTAHTTACWPTPVVSAIVQHAHSSYESPVPIVVTPASGLHPWPPLVALLRIAPTVHYCFPQPYFPVFPDNPSTPPPPILARS
ncbi:hypothetical protein AX774_g4450 [Zancudomyces culisetae]|uniref:Uncharacterized protein n=1 Tax=Zancudomyces culisetae TaxID=1213189 RepID=A0A1R1PM95_ZANCU|nr:hypothetical protein AX774_g4450 [Zancudomyces culisetae]|eukprot:OMH82091.1 hypothetical protein AX774_g4450 [Zancudomyces culisetae]